jgi:hypothetical protein
VSDPRPHLYTTSNRALYNLGMGFTTDIPEADEPPQGWNYPPLTATITFNALLSPEAAALILGYRDATEMRYDMRSTHRWEDDGGQTL